MKYSTTLETEKEIIDIYTEDDCVVIWDEGSGNSITLKSEEARKVAEMIYQHVGTLEMEKFKKNQCQNNVGTVPTPLVWQCNQSC